MQPGGELRLRVLDADGELATLESKQLPPFAISEPAVFTSTEDGGQILVAYATEDGTIVLARAACFEPFK
jgi:hypothetical protein